MNPNEKALVREKIQWERMLPAEFRAAMATLPIVFLPLGTVEWHGEHNALGLDALKAHELCVCAAHRAGGGVVHPALYGGMGGLDKPATVVMEGEYAWENTLLRPWLEKLCSEFQRIGFKAMIILTGHYGHNQQIVVRETAARMAERLQMPILGLPEYWLAHDIGYWGDHAGIGETSLLWHLHPTLVDMTRIRSDPDYGRDGRIEQGASPALGQRYAGLIIERLAHLAAAMPQWSAAQVAASIRADRALVSAQIRGWRTEHPWAAWRKIGSGQVTDYGRLLVEARFAEIEELAGQLLAE